MSLGRHTVGRLLGTLLVAAATATAGLTVGAGSAAAAPGGIHTPARQLAQARAHAGRLSAPDRSSASLAETGTRTTFRTAGRGSDEDPYLVVDPGCVGKTGGKARPNAAVGSSTKLKVDYVLTGSASRRTGTVKVKAGRESSLKLASVPVGSYRLTLTRHGSTTEIGAATFDVLPCVAVQTSCHAVTFTNPAGNPTAYVTYVGHKKKQGFDIEVPAGTSRAVRADYSRVDYLAFGYDETVDGSSSRLGEGKVSVKQHCSVTAAQPGSNAVSSTASVGCSAGGAPADVLLEWSVQPSVKKTRYEVVDDASRTTVRSASFSGGKHASIALARGSYHYRSYAAGVAAPFEDVAFTVLGCVQVTPVCRALEIDNPNAVTLDVSVFGYDADDESDEGTSVDTTAAPSATTTIPWDRTVAYAFVWAADEDPGSSFVTEPLTPDLGFGDVELTVPQDC